MRQEWTICFIQLNLSIVIIINTITLSYKATPSKCHLKFNYQARFHMYWDSKLTANFSQQETPFFIAEGVAVLKKEYDCNKINNS